MNKSTVQTIVGLSIGVCGFSAPIPAAAELWKNFANETQCLGVQAGNMTSGTRLIMWDCNMHSDQNWGEQPYSGNYVQLWSGGSAAPPSNAAECIALYDDGSIANGNPAIIWNCSADTTDQAWQLVWYGTDANSHDCYYFQNKKAYDVSGAFKVLRPNIWLPHWDPSKMKGAVVVLGGGPAYYYSDIFCRY
jgi:hypothetical protein